MMCASRLQIVLKLHQSKSTLATTLSNISYMTLPKRQPNTKIMRVEHGDDDVLRTEKPPLPPQASTCLDLG